MAISPINDVSMYQDEAGAMRAAEGFVLIAGPVLGLNSRTVPSVPNQTGGTIATSGGTAAVLFANTDLTEIVNPSTSSLWARWQAAPGANGAGSFEIRAGGSFVRDRVAGTLNLLSTVAGQTYTVNRYVPS